MQVRNKIQIFLFLLIACSCQAQILEDLDSRFFTMRNSRISIGAHFSANFANGDGDADMNINIGSLPKGVEVKFDTTQGLPYLSAGVLFDWFAPNSKLGFVFGADYNAKTFQLVNDLNQTALFDIKQVQIPVYLKWKFGKIHARTNGLFMLGAFYAAPIQYSRRYNNVETNLKDELQSSFNISSMLGLQFRFAGKDKLNTEIFDGSIEYPRMWGFIRADMPLENTFNPASPNAIFPNHKNEELDYRAINISIGVAFFFGFKK